MAWPYVLPWYDGLGWALLALLPLSALPPALPRPRCPGPRCPCPRCPGPGGLRAWSWRWTG